MGLRVWRWQDARGEQRRSGLDLDKSEGEFFKNKRNDGIQKSPTIIPVLGGLVNKCKSKVHPGSIYNAAVCGDKRRLLEKHSYVSWEMLGEINQAHPETGRGEFPYPVSNDNHPPSGKNLRPCRLTSSKVVYSLISSDQILVEIIVSPDIGLAHQTLELGYGSQSRFGLARSTTVLDGRRYKLTSITFFC